MTEPTHDLNLKIIASLLHYVKERHGSAALADVLAPSGRPVTNDDPDGWVSHEQFEEILKRSRALMASDHEFVRACSYQAIERYGPLIILFRAGTVRGAFGAMVRTTVMVSSISKFTIENVGPPNTVRISYRSSKAESRHMCLSRQAQLKLVPSLWPGLPRANLIEEKCIARGDDSCTYVVRWAETLRTRWSVVGALAGAVFAFALPELTDSIGGPLLSVLPVVGGALGLAYAFAESARTTTMFQEGTSGLVEELVQDHERALTELRSMSQREQSYTGLLEERVRVRTEQLEAVIGQVVAIQERQSISLRGLSHDMRSPLQVLTFLSFRLRSKELFDGPVIAGEIDASVRRLRDQLGQLADVATNQPDAFALRTTRIPLDGLADRIKSHLDALLLGRGVSASCFRTREAPESIVSDATLFDRIVDNIVTNAAKYTDRGSIVVEVSGSPGTLSIKVSDTGRGISPDRLEHVFTGAEPDQNPAIGDSLGIGLANTVRLLDQVGGRLELMSRPSMGTTVWIHLPVEREVETPESSPIAKASPSEAIQDVVRRVVRIRAAH
ncbi:hypothetical protein BH09MYX1_BH09MYX1_43530 [soil metagenome]